MSAIQTIKQRALTARSFYNQPNKFVCIGRQNAWTNDSNPPQPTGYETSIDTPIVYKKVDEIAFAKLDQNGSLVYNDAHYITTSDVNLAFTEGFTLVYTKTTITKTQAPVGVTYRQVGIYTGVTATVDANGISYPAGTTGKTNVVSSEGTLATIDNRLPLMRSADQSEIIEIMIQF